MQNNKWQSLCWAQVLQLIDNMSQLHKWWNKYIQKLNQWKTVHFIERYKKVLFHPHNKRKKTSLCFQLLHCLVKKEVLYYLLEIKYLLIKDTHICPIHYSIKRTMSTEPFLNRASSMLVQQTLYSYKCLKYRNNRLGIRRTFFKSPFLIKAH